MDIKEMKKYKKNIDILEVAATDKENLSKKLIPKKKLNLSNGRIRIGKKEGKIIESQKKDIVEIKNNINKSKNKISQRGKSSLPIIATDLTSDIPTEKYWEKLAESRRIALESALKENVDLNNKLSEMEYENSRLKEMLREAQSLVEVLTEMLDDNKEHDSDDEKSINKTNPASKCDKEVNSDSDIENDSFQSCT